jgi:enoyl-CoA hydratase/carnithine racemase
MHFGCQRIDAQTALDWGLVNRVVPQAELNATALEMAKGFAQHDPAIMAEMKRLADQGYDLPLQDGLDLENAAVSAWKRRKQ